MTKPRIRPDERWDWLVLYPGSVLVYRYPGWTLDEVYNRAIDRMRNKAGIEGKSLPPSRPSS